MYNLVSPYAGGGTRTPKGLLPPDFESPATAGLWGTTGYYRAELCGIQLRWILLSTLWYPHVGHSTGTVAALRGSFQPNASASEQLVTTMQTGSATS